jgi:acetylornithine deacetylase/succinyl-diaminopimelate desuccinylase-like protein
LAFDTINPPGRETPCATFIYDFLCTAGFDAQLHPMPDGRTNLVARVGNGTGRPLVFSGHLDTVPLGNQPWSVDPFSGNIREGRLYRRGSTDMKAGVAAFVCAAIEEVDIAIASADTDGYTVGEEFGQACAIFRWKGDVRKGKALGPTAHRCQLWPAPVKINQTHLT